uniref:Uncharacterized protein n=1 Tax=Arundo donax TaxID=35708 RepID=A0A0A8YC20_ARUDO
MTCLLLEHLEISDSYLCVEKITSKSLKHMIIKNCGFNRNQGFRTLIYVLSLVSLSLDGQM